ncbi:MAG TPA: M48 family metalloprotease [Pyrinomonadaceae bacterium]
MIKSLAYKFVCLTAALFMLALAAPLTSAQEQQRDMRKEAEIWKELASISPGAVETFKRATEAMDKGDGMEAIRRYGEVMLEAPKWDVVHRRLGFSLLVTGQTKEGTALIRKAVELKRSPENLISLAQVMAYPGPDIQASTKDKEQALQLAKEASAKRTDQTDVSYPAVVAQLSLDLNREQDFRAATKELVSRHQDLMETHYFNAILAAADNQLSTAKQEIERAGQMGLPAEAVESFLVETGIRSREKAWRYAYIAGSVVLAWALGLVLLFVLGGILSKRTLQGLETADPETLVSPEHDKLRSVYRKVINIAGLYYYISIPVVILLILGLTGAIIYGMMSAGSVPVKLVLVLAICAIITTFQMIKSLFTRPKQEDPGRALLEKEAPGLWALSREVASTVGTRAVDEIRVTPGTEVAVYERGGFRERMQDRAERVLLVGVGVLNGFDQNAFRAVLAHEYGHFIHRDTAGGDMAFRVQSDMMKFARGIILSGQNTAWNLGFQFLRLYHRIFTRISHGAGRLQEALADRRASYHFGATAFEEGLSHVVRRQIEFEHLVTKEINMAVEDNRALVNLYDLSGVEGKEQHLSVEEEFQKAINRKTAETDTHPSPAERFRLARRVVSKEVSATQGSVWDLFADRENITREMSSLVDAQVRGVAA